MSKMFIFDMGHVIIKPSNFKLMYEQMETECDIKELKRLFYHSELSDAVYTGKITDDDFFKLIKQISNSKKSFLELKNIYYYTKGKVYSDTLDLILKLKKLNYKISILSNLKEIDEKYLWSVIEQDLFDYKFLSYKMGLAKPNPKIFEEVKKIINYENFENVYFFDDAIDNIETAKKANITSFLVTGDTIKEKVEEQKILLP